MSSARPGSGRPRTKNSASNAKNAVSAMPVDCGYASTPQRRRRVTVVGLAGAGVHDGADDDQGLLNAEGVNVRGRTSGISCMSVSAMPWKPRMEEPSKSWPLTKKIVINRRQVEVLLHAGHVSESDISRLLLRS